MSSLTDCFAWTRTHLFPRWDAAQWRLEVGTRSEETNENGYCDREQRVIYVRSDFEHRDATERRLLLAHEVCHAIAGYGHSRKFCERLRCAAGQARTIGEPALASALEEEAKLLENTPPLRADAIYAQVRDWVLHAENVPSFDRISSALAREYGLTRVEQQRRYRRLGRVYEDAVAMHESLESASRRSL